MDDLAVLVRTSGGSLTGADCRTVKRRGACGMLGFDAADGKQALLGLAPAEERRRALLVSSVSLVASALALVFLGTSSVWASTSSPPLDLAIQASGLAHNSRPSANGFNFHAKLRAERVPSACDPKPVNSRCNPLATSCPMPPNATALSELVAECIVGGALAFCGYAGMDRAGYPNDAGDGVGPMCSLTQARVPFAQPPSPATAFAAPVGPDFVCFNSSKNAWDRLCITRQWLQSVDCVHPASARSEFLTRMLSAGEADFRGAHDGRAPQFQCFHRGGFGSVPWLHLHSFDGHADSICPEMSTAGGESPNPLPHQIVCANGERSVEERVRQMLTILEGYRPEYS